MSNAKQIESDLISRGSFFAGNDPAGIAEEWADEFSPSDAAAWMDARFWDVSTAAALRDAGLSPQNAIDAAEAMIANEDDNDYTDGCPIYSCCNHDTPVQAIIDAHKLANE